MRSNKLFMGCGIAAIVGLVLAIAGVLLTPLFLSSASANVGQSEGIQVFLVQPVSESTFAVNKPVKVDAEAVGVIDIQKMDLWVDDHLWVTGATASAVGKTRKANWEWTPSEEGQFTLMVRATNKDGIASNSNLIQVNIVAEDTVPTPDPLAPIEPTAETPPDGTTPGGGMAMEEVPPPPPFPPEGDPPETDEEGSLDDGVSIDDWIISVFEIVTPPTAPHVWVKLTDPCDITLTIEDKSDNETGFVINRIDPGSAVYKQIAKLDSHNGTGSFKYVDTGLGLGKYRYAVYAINSVFQTMANIVSITNTGVCQAAPGSNALGVSNTTIDPSQQVTQVYCYMSKNGVDWSRIPPDANTFITGINGKFDVGPYLGEPGGFPIALDCWGWNGGTLIHLGKSELTYETIAPPKNFHFVQNPDECGNVGTSQTDKAFKVGMCQLFQQSGWKIVMWDWQPKPIQICAMSNWACWQKLVHYTADEIDGFAIYYNYPGSSVKNVITLAGQDVHIGFVIPKPQQGLLKPEYYIRAFKGTMESADSNHKNP
jgi:hypothetical protein